MKFVITIPMCPFAMIVEADSRVEALCKIGATVWTEEDWMSAEQRLRDRSYPVPQIWDVRKGKFI
jgi:hypothetical protein